MFDVLIFGAGAAGVSCALVLGSAHAKPFVSGKKIGIIAHQKGSYLQDALLNNVYGIAPGSFGIDVLNQSLRHLSDSYPHIEQISDEKVLCIRKTADGYEVGTNRNHYKTKLIVVATNSGSSFMIEGLTEYVIPHRKSLAAKNRVQLENIDHKVTDGIYVAGTLAGHRSQVAIAAGSGAAVATDILTLWNEGIETHAHDSHKK